MIRLKPLFVKILDRVTIQEAPSVFEGKFGFSNSEQLCNKEGFYRLIEVEKTGTIACYEQQDNTVVQSWVTVDMNEYSKRVVSRIRAKYTEDEELSILRKKDAGIDVTKFAEYNDFCEKVKREVKIELLTPIDLEQRKSELIKKFKPVQDIFTNRLAKISNILGENHDYILRLKNICRFRREQTLETILSFTTIEQAMAFDIRESDMQPILSIMDIVENNPLSNTQAIDYAGQAITQIEQYFGIV
jgi:hypothetical protein